MTSLLEHERIETTEAKAKELRIVADRMVTLGKDGSLSARRRAAAYIRSKPVVAKLFQDIAGRFSERLGGYTRLIKTRRRVGDAALMVVIELVARPTEKHASSQGKSAAQSGSGASPKKSSATPSPTTLPSTPATAGA